MDFIGNLLNQMSSAFNQETAIPKKEEISMDETLKWRALKNNQFASRTRGATAAAAAASARGSGSAPATRSGSSIGRRSSGRTGGSSNGQRKQRPHSQPRAASENSNDSVGAAVDTDGSLIGFDEEGSNCSGLLAVNGGAGDDPEEDIEIEIAKDISGEELQEALGLSQLLEVDSMDIPSMEEEQVIDQLPAGLTVGKREPNGDQTIPDKKDTLVLDNDRKMESVTSSEEIGNSTPLTDHTTSDEIAKKEKVSGSPIESAVRDPTNGKTTATNAKDRDEKLPSIRAALALGCSIASVSGTGPPLGERNQTADRITDGGQKVELDQTASFVEETVDDCGDSLKSEEVVVEAIDDGVDDDDDDVLIISTGDVTDVVELAETSKEDDEDDEEKEDTEKELGGRNDSETSQNQQKSDVRTTSTMVHEETEERKQAPEVNPVQDTGVADPSHGQPASDEAEEKYHPSLPSDLGEADVSSTDVVDEEAKFSSTLTTSESSRQETKVHSTNDEPQPPPILVEEKPVPRPDVAKQETESETKEREDHVADEANALVGGRTTRSKKSTSVAVIDSPSATLSQRRSQRFQVAKDSPAGGRKSADVKLNGGENSSDGLGPIVVVKEEAPDEPTTKKRTNAGGTVASVKGMAKVASATGTSVAERRISAKSDRSLRSRQQSTNSSGLASVSVVTRRSSESVKSVGTEDSTTEVVETATPDRMNRRARKRASQDPASMDNTSAVATREKAPREVTPPKEDPVVSTIVPGFPLDPGENDSGGGKDTRKLEQQKSEQSQEQQQQAPAPSAAMQRRGRKRKTMNASEATGAPSGPASSGSPEKPPPYKRAARVSRDGSDGILASALARRDKVDPQGRLFRPIKLSAKMLANEELRYGFEQHSNGRIFIGADNSSAGERTHDEPPVPMPVVVVDREKERDRTTQDAGGSDKTRKQHQQNELPNHKEVNLPPANSAISSSSEDVTVISVTYPSGKGPATGGQSLIKKQTDTSTTFSSSDRQRSSAKTGAGGVLVGNSTSAGSSKRARPPGVSTSSTAPCPDVQTFLQEIRASRICTNRSPEDNRKLNRRQTKRLAKLKEKHLLALGLQRKGTATQPVRNGAVSVPRKSSPEMDEGMLLSEAEPESESSGSEADFVPNQKIGTVGKPSVTLRLRKPETLLERTSTNASSATSTNKQRHQQQQHQQPPPLVTVPSAMVNRGTVGAGGRQPVTGSRNQHGVNKQASQQASNGRMAAHATSKRSSSAMVLPAAMTTVTTSGSSVANRKDRETEQLQRSLERFGCELTLIPTNPHASINTPPSSDGRSSSSSSSHTNRKRVKEPTGAHQRSLVRPNHHHPRHTQASPSSSVLASTSPSLQIVLEKRPQPPSGPRPATGKAISTLAGSPPSSTGDDRPLVCLCRQMSDIFVASSIGTGYCTAVDDIDGQRIGCCNELTEELVHMLRPSPTVSFQLLCNLHRKRLEDHNCCAICGVYCTQGNFAMCKNAHIFHPDCAVKYVLNAPYDPARPTDHTAPTLVLQCPHCTQECPNGEIQVNVQLTNPPVLLPSRKHILKPAKMAIARSKGSTNGASTTKDAFRANVDSFVPSRVRNMLGAGGSGTEAASNGHDQSSPVGAGGSGTAARNHFTTKQIFEAIHKDDVDRITEIIISGFDIEKRFRDFHDGTCLHLVSNFGSIGMAYLIICRAQSVDFLNILDRELRTALMCAVLGAKNDIVKLLLECGADVTVKGPDGMTVLHLAAKLGQHEAVRMILEWARKRLTARELLAFVNGVDNGPYTALVWAAENRHKETIQHLLASGADVNICDKENNTSLHWAAMAGCSGSMHLLLKKGCDPNVQNINGDTPLHLACRHGNGDICIMLLTMGASLNVRNESNELPQDMLRNPNSECASIIGANVKMFSLGKNTKETRIMSSDISNGREYYPVQVVHIAGRNERQQTLPKFKYIQKSVQIECRIDTNMCDMIVCSCKDSCISASSGCLCSERTWYTDDGRLVSDFDFLAPPTIVECGDLCDCNQLLCRNRVVQRGLRVPLQLFYSSGKAWGVRTLVAIPKGTFLVEYVGELLTDEVANQRPDDTYFFDLNSGYCIDANAYGNVSRFFNHSCDPNVSPVSVYYEHQDKRFPKVAMFACRDIKAQEEICFNYGEKFWMVKNRTMSCLCNASECRYRTVQHAIVL